MTERAFLELRYFRMRSGPQVDRTTAYLRDVWLPEMQKAGAGPVGIFSSLIGPQSPTILTVVGREPLAVISDTDFDADYIRMESSILKSFRTVPQIEAPTASEHRVFELRTYESANDRTLSRKIQMFDDGEISIFRRCGIIPVFFGRTIIGRDQPNLTYMVTFDDLAARERAWRTFAADPEWQKLRATPGLTDAEIVSNVTSSVYRPLPFSPIH
jgi:hypothetical protein